MEMKGNRQTDTTSFLSLANMYGTHKSYSDVCVLRVIFLERYESVVQHFVSNFTPKRQFLKLNVITSNTSTTAYSYI